MASIPAEIADAGVKRLLAELSDAIDDIKSLKDNMEKLDAAMDALQACKDELMRKIDARRSIWQGDPRGKVINWLQKVEKLEGCVDKTKEEFDGMMVGCLGDFLSNVFLSWRVSKVAKKWHALATQFGDEYNNFTDADLVTDLGPGVIAERPSGAEMSPEKAYEELKNHIGDHDASIVVIHGIGGVGKSELLERLNREIARIKNRRTWKGEAEEEPMSFDRVFWINARDLKGEKEVQKAVVDEMELTLPAKKTDQNEIAACIYDKVKKNKYLVVLNDVWSPIDLTKHGHVGFMLSCYDAQLSYDSHTDTFQARYPPHGRRTIVIEEGVQWDRLRAPPVDTSAHDLHVSDCLHDLRPGDHIEIHWRRNKEFPYGWWYGVVGHLESCDRNEHFCRCSTSVPIMRLKIMV